MQSQQPYPNEYLLLEQLINESAWVPDWVEKLAKPKRVLYKIGPIPVFEYQPPAMEDYKFGHYCPLQDNTLVNEETKKMETEEKNQVDSLPKPDDIDNRLKESLSMYGSELTGIFGLLQNFIDSCLNDDDDTIDLNNFWKFAEK